VFKVQLIEAANTGQENTVIKLAHILSCLKHDGRICRLIILG
jgi:hypothetical protein